MATLKSNLIEPATGTDLNIGAAGDILTLSSDSIQTNLYKDSGGNTIFQSDGAGTLSNVNSGLQGSGPNLITTQTASGVSAVEFTTGIDNTYDKYMFVFYNIGISTDTAYFRFVTSSDSGSSWNANACTNTFFEAHHYYDWSTGTGLAYDTSRDSAQDTGDVLLTNHLDNGASTGTTGILNLYGPSSTTYVKQWTCVTSSPYYLPTSQVQIFTGGYFNTTNAINGVKFTVNSGNFNGTIKMYGVS